MKTYPSPVRCRSKHRSRRGTIIVFTAVLIVVIFALVAFAVDLGFLYNARTQLQRTADASAMAGASAIYPPPSSLSSVVYSLSPDITKAREESRKYVQLNEGAGRALDVDLNPSNAPGGDIVLGKFVTPWDQSEKLNTNSDSPNTVFVRVSLTRSHANGSVPLFFAPVLGFADAEVTAQAAATVWYPALLPFATSEPNWQSLGDGGAGDGYTYKPKTLTFGTEPGPDGIPEIVMFPGNWNDGGLLPPGNFGIIEIGGGGSEVTTLRRQIDVGPSKSDMDYHGGSLVAGETLPGRTGIKSSTKHAFLGGYADSQPFGGMLGEVRTLPIFQSAVGNGDNAVFTLSRFVVVRILAIKIDSRWRTDRNDTEGDDITGIMAQPVVEPGSLIQTRLTR